MTEDEMKAVNISMAWYLPLMHEVRLRLDLVKDACEGKLNLPPPYAREYAYLQFRRICELVALGCLKLHGDLPETQSKSTKKEWHAENIFRLLKKNHESAFPQPFTRTEVDGAVNIQANSKPNALTYEEFGRLYNECGEVLHRGTIKMLESAKPLTSADYEKITVWQSKLVDLLNQHLVTRTKKLGMYAIYLKTDTGYPTCHHLKPDGKGGLEVMVGTMDVKTQSQIVKTGINSTNPVAFSDYFIQ